MGVRRALGVATASLASGARLGVGFRVGGLGPRPERPLELYEFEACPFCRRVREALTALDLEVRIRPCPKQGTRFRPEVQSRGGKQQFPYLVDPNTGAEMYESADIVAYLFDSYGDANVPILLRQPIVGLASPLASVVRLGRGLRARPSAAPEQELELYGFESSPFCRIAREALCELEIPYLLHNLGKGSPSRQAFIERSGKMMVPYLVDPNSGVEMFESDDIVRYLNRTYGA